MSTEQSGHGLGVDSVIVLSLFSMSWASSLPVGHGCMTTGLQETFAVPDRPYRRQSTLQHIPWQAMCQSMHLMTPGSSCLIIVSDLSSMSSMSSCGQGSGPLLPSTICCSSPPPSSIAAFTAAEAAALPPGSRSEDAPIRELQSVVPSGSHASKVGPRSSTMGHNTAWASAFTVQVLPKLTRP